MFMINLCYVFLLEEKVKPHTLWAIEEKVKPHTLWAIDSGAFASCGSEVSDAAPTLETKSLTVSQRTLQQKQKKFICKKKENNKERTKENQEWMRIQMSEQMNEWMNEWMNEQIDEWMNRWMDE